MDQIINSFNVKRTLNPEIWDAVDAESMQQIKLKGEIRTKLLHIAESFIESLKLPDIEIEDVLFLGSLSGFNWSKFSDVDLHILIDKSKIEGDETMVTEFFDAKKQLFNQKHEIIIKGYDVEIYVQDMNEPNQSNGIYSVLYNKWNKIPEPESTSIDKSAIIQKVRDFNKDFKAIKAMDSSDAKIARITALSDRIKKYRQAGLQNNGEMSTENLVFKYLRRSGYMEDLIDLKTSVLDDILSLKEGRIFT